MNPPESAILDFENWSHPSTFYDFVINDHSLLKTDKEMFQFIWAAAHDSQNWSDADLVLGCKVTHSRIKSQFNLEDEVITRIVRAASYQGNGMVS